MAKYRDTEVSGFLLNSGYPLRQIRKVLKTLMVSEKSDAAERRADHELKIRQPWNPDRSSR